jgi:aspartyl-tRNA(Asn)/glutamyl-tRNA(Gln) amidotransferase subunit A
VSLSDLCADPAAARRALDAREVSVPELTRAALERAEKLQPLIGAFAEITRELALEQAERAQEALAAGGARSFVHGLPLAVKDVIDVAGVPTRLGTPAAGHRLPSASAPVVAALAAAGAVTIGKTATHELAYGMVTPRARNPRDPERITGGSSGGSAAAVAAGIAALSLGTDTNGSVRCPAAHCGVIGFKPTRKLLPLEGVAPLARTQDTLGLLAPDARTAGAAWELLAGTGTAAPDRARIGVDRDACARARPDVAATVLAALESLDAAGEAELVEVRAPDLGLAGSASVLAIVREAGEAWREELVAHPGGFGPQLRGALRAEVPEAAYGDAKRARGLICRELAELFARERLDALALPSVPVTATPAGAERVELHGLERSVEALQSLFTALASLSGQPALSLPCGSGADGMPVGLQLLGRAGGDAALLDLAARAERTLST